MSTNTVRRTLPPQSLVKASRIVGLDIARGLAVIGMFAAHTLIVDSFDWGDPATWADIVSGRSSILFATLAGVSIAIISGGRTVHTGITLVQSRMRILVRAVLLFALGGLLTGLGTPVYVILEYYAVLFVLALPFLRWSPRRLFTLAGILAIVSPILQLVLSAVYDASGFRESTIAELFLTGHYPAITWIVFVLVGLGLGRLDLTSQAVTFRVLLSGIALAILGYGVGSLSAAIFPAPGTSGASPGTDGADWVTIFDLRSLSTVEPHSGSIFEVIGSQGFALAVIALCLLVATPLRTVLFPIAATGSMALSAYSVQLLGLALVGNAYWTMGSDNSGLFLVLTVVIVITCTVWAIFVGKGPLEQILTHTSQLASGSLLPRSRRYPTTPAPDAASDPPAPIESLRE